jgi:CubicO group peptidase (beta-lactamase class C family)
MPRRVGDIDSAENATDAQNPADRDFSSAKAKIDDFCREWATATGEPFVTMIVSDGQVVTHEAFGATKDGQPIDRDYRCWIASITKTVTGIMFARFIDQNLIGLDDSLSSVFPDYPKNNPHVPTFRQCLNHTAGFEGHGDFGGVNNPHFENLILNAIEINELGNASSDAEMTAAELSALGQLLLGRGSYRGHQFFRPDTFDQLLPQSLSVTDAPSHGYGVGLHWIRHRRPSTEPKGQQNGELLFSSNTIGHGSFSGCILVIDLDRKLVITQARREFREQDDTWFQRYFAVVADALKP